MSIGGIADWFENNNIEKKNGQRIIGFSYDSWAMTVKKSANSWGKYQKLIPAKWMYFFCIGPVYYGANENRTNKIRSMCEFRERNEIR